MTIATIVQAAAAADSAAPGIGGGALAFMLICIGAVTLLTAWCYLKILGDKQHFDPDGTGPAKPPVEGKVEREGGL